MTINCNLTESDYRAMRKYVMFRYRKMHWFLAVVLISLLALVWFSNKPEATTGEKIAGLVGKTRVAGIRHIAETPAHFFILTTTGGAHVVPKRDVQSFEALRSLQARVTK